MSAPLVTMRHMRIAGYCSRGTRTFFARHGLDWSGFLRNGIPARALEGTGDAMAVRVARMARAEALHHGR
jgi:hypothetical protein